MSAATAEVVARFDVKKVRSDFPILGRQVHGLPLVYLDNAKNDAEHPNENYARELMELFTLGVDQYTEKDVRESARAWTGWIVPRRTQQATFVRSRHDDGSKMFLGKTGNFSGRDIVGVAPQKILAERRAFVRNGGVRADETHRHSAVVLAERFGGAQAGRSAADDDEPWFGHRCRILEGPQV